MRLDRFVEAQDGVYNQALAELRCGRKTSHWMWFIFPQIAGLGRSSMAQHYAIRDLEEARTYLDHPLLGARLAECARAMLGWTGVRSAEAILGEIDAIKLCSSATLFEAASGDEQIAALLDAFYAGERDAETLARL